MSSAFKIVQGDCLEKLREIPDNSISSIVTDPPYGLSNTKPAQVADVLKAWVTGDTEAVPAKKGGFMGKDWDSFVPPPAVWEECLRVLKPGGHMAVFAGARTQDLMGLSIRLAGFEIRDTLGWIYGSGFPKSHDIGKAINKAAGAEREVVGAGKSGKTYGMGGLRGVETSTGSFDLTAPATSEAKRWDGWGTAIKPAWEPILLAQKPFNVVPLYEVANKTHHILGVLKWLSLSPAKRAEITSPSSHQEQHEEMCAFALANVETEQSPEKYAATDTFRSPEMALTYLNTAKLWQSILGAISDPTITFTTSTESSTITVLKTLNSLLAPITSATTMPPCECLLNGQPSNVTNVESNSSESWSNWQATLNVSVPESVIEQTAKTALSLLANIAENLSQPGTAAGGGSVLPHAQIGLVTQSGESQNDHVNGVESLTSLAGIHGGSVPSAAQQNSSAIEPIILARKPLDGTVAANVLAHGVGGLNIDACRVGTAGGTKATNFGETAGTMYGGGAGKPKNDIEELSAGRFPANVLLDEHAAKEMDKQSGTLKSGGGNKAPKKSSWYTSNSDEVEDVRNPNEGGASRFFPVFKYQAKAPKKERPVIEREDGTKIQHPTVKPVALMEWLVTLITPEKGVTLDPFAGTGTTLEAAKNKGIKAIGIEQDPEYIQLIEQRLNR